jgi:hypothetical protein
MHPSALFVKLKAKYRREEEKKTKEEEKTGRRTSRGGVFSGFLFVRSFILFVSCMKKSVFRKAEKRAPCPNPSERDRRRWIATFRASP